MLFLIPRQSMEHDQQLRSAAKYVSMHKYIDLFMSAATDNDAPLALVQEIKKECAEAQHNVMWVAPEMVTDFCIRLKYNMATPVMSYTKTESEPWFVAMKHVFENYRVS